MDWTIYYNWDLILLRLIYFLFSSITKSFLSSSFKYQEPFVRKIFMNRMFQINGIFHPLCTDRILGWDKVNKVQGKFTKYLVFDLKFPPTSIVREQNIYMFVAISPDWFYGCTQLYIFLALLIYIYISHWPANIYIQLTPPINIQSGS